MEVTITFTGGATILAEQNGNCFICDNKPTIPVDLSVVTVDGVNGTSVFHNAVFTECASVDGRYWFSFYEKSADDLEKEQLRETIATLEDALCEQDAANEERLAAIEDALCEMDIA